ncbi:MAG: chorismate synthase [Deltaproteobacteria bacterium]|jgi:chorismate synthase|nr:chorismate synthase [Deltaproteobacteria bacterium]
MGSLLGRYFSIMTFGESHGAGLGVVIDGLPAGLAISQEDLQRDLDRRKPGQSEFTTARRESDQVEILSGLTSQGLTNGAPLALLVRNQEARGADYAKTAQVFRPGHADWTYFKKYGLKPQAGGGRASGRETVGRVAAGAVARQLLKALGITVRSGTMAVGPIWVEKIDWAFSETNALKFLDQNSYPQASQAVLEAKDQGDSLGSVVTVSALGLPVGWGDPVFDKLEALLGQAFFSIGAVKAVEFGDGLALSRMRGSQANDPMGPQGPLRNRHGGILGGLSSGTELLARLYLKPTPSIALDQETINLEGQPSIISITGRHDPCLAPRLGPVAEAMCLITLADCYLRGPAQLEQIWPPK